MAARILEFEHYLCLGQPTLQLIEGDCLGGLQLQLLAN